VTDDMTVKALGKLSEALETTERARGHLYEMHQLTGTADFQLDEAVSLFMQAGHDVVPGHWTFQLVEEYDDGYYTDFRTVEREAREKLADGRRHLHEAQLKKLRQS
jgi:AAA+ ATPase superfamily predicted ATPase